MVSKVDKISYINDPRVERRSVVLNGRNYSKLRELPRSFDVNAKMKSQAICMASQHPANGKLPFSLYVKFEMFSHHPMASFICFHFPYCLFLVYARCILDLGILYTLVVIKYSISITTTY